MKVYLHAARPGKGATDYVFSAPVIVPLNDSPVTVGRQSGAVDVCLASKDKTVASRKHAVLERAAAAGATGGTKGAGNDSGWMVRDLGSMNHTFVNFVRLGLSGTRRLAVGDVVHFGGSSSAKPGEWVDPAAMASPFAYVVCKGKPPSGHGVAPQPEQSLPPPAKAVAGARFLASDTASRSPAAPTNAAAAAATRGRSTQKDAKSAKSGALKRRKRVASSSSSDSSRSSRRGAVAVRKGSEGKDGAGDAPANATPTRRTRSSRTRKSRLSPAAAAALRRDVEMDSDAGEGTSESTRVTRSSARSAKRARRDSNAADEGSSEHRGGATGRSGGRGRLAARQAKRAGTAAESAPEASGNGHGGTGTRRSAAGPGEPMPVEPPTPALTLPMTSNASVSTPANGTGSAAPGSAMSEAPATRGSLVSPVGRAVLPTPAASPAAPSVVSPSSVSTPAVTAPAEASVASAFPMMMPFAAAMAPLFGAAFPATTMAGNGVTPEAIARAAMTMMIAAANPTTQASLPVAASAVATPSPVAVPTACASVQTDMPSEHGSLDADVMKRELSCGLCHDLLLDAAVLPCTHGFCAVCIATAWKTAPRCPNCPRKRARARRRAMEVVTARVPYCRSSHLDGAVLSLLDCASEAARDSFDRRAGEHAEAAKKLCLRLVDGTFTDRLAAEQPVTADTASETHATGMGQSIPASTFGISSADRGRSSEEEDGDNDGGGAGASAGGGTATGTHAALEEEGEEEEEEDGDDGHDDDASDDEAEHGARWSEPSSEA